MQVELLDRNGRTVTTMDMRYPPPARVIVPEQTEQRVGFNPEWIPIPQSSFTFRQFVIHQTTGGTYIGKEQ
jgi:hypothetical protein